MNLRRRLLFGAGLGAAALSLASAAFACTGYKGDMTFTVNDGTNPASSQTMTGSGNVISSDGGMTWCGGNPSSWTMTTNHGTVGVNVTLTISSAAASSCNSSGTNFLSAGQYQVGLAHGFMGNSALGLDGTTTNHINCHQAHDTSHPLPGGLFIVGANGVGTAQNFQYLSNSSPGYDNICVFGAGLNSDANDVNVVVV